MMTFSFFWLVGGTGEIEGRRRGMGWEGRGGEEVNTSKGGKRVGKRRKNGKGKGAGND